MKLPYEELLDFFLWSLEVVSRRDCGLILAGYRVTEHERRANQLLTRLERQRLIERQGRGATATFRITTEGRRRATARNPAESWAKPWDGKWRVFNYDLPETRRQDRLRICRALHDHKFGLLQRSLWIWPHAAEQALREIVDAQGIPECFCGFQSERLFLCADAELITAAWDFEEIEKRHRAYLQHLVANVDAVKAARDMKALARVARIEQEAHGYAFSLDPLLPRVLWPKGYHGELVQSRHEIFRNALRQRATALAT